jgi:NAD(P)-dependent dehydrogenase (short-subunit alcohol dehydrogenase family)
MSDAGSTPQSRAVAISGAGTGIGQAAARKFAALGWRVAIGGRRAGRLAETRSLIEDAGGTCIAHELDVTDGASVDRFFDTAEAGLGTVTAVINNAATARYGPLHDFSHEDIAAEVGTKHTGSLLMSARANRGMRNAGAGGDIVFVTSAAGVMPWVEHLPYAAANAGAEHAARILRLELEGTGIRVGVLRVGETIGTEFAVRGMEVGVMPNELWFRRGLLRHAGTMTPEHVADAMVAMVSLPPTHQYEVLAVMPTAPKGEMPATLGEWMEGIVKLLPS